MANPRHDRPALLSVLDRLVDDDPRAPEDLRTTAAESVRHLKASVLRDLEWLLNTRRTPEPIPDAFVEVRRSVYRYGLPDTTSLSRDSPVARRRLRRELEECLRSFEPRLEAVEIEVAHEEGPLDQVRFVVEAILRMDPDPERVRFDTLLDASSGQISVRGGSGA